MSDKFNIDDWSNMVGYLGQCYTILELGKRGVKAQTMSQDFDYDLTLSNSLQVEVKSATIFTVQDKRLKSGKTRNVWQFVNFQLDNKYRKHHRRLRRCDYYIFVCLDKNQKPLKYFIVPNSIIDSLSNLSR